MEPAVTTQLLLQLIEGTIERQDFLHLQAELGRNPEARREYSELLALDHLLAEKFGAPQRIFASTEPSDELPQPRRFRLVGFIKPLLAISSAAAVVALILSVGFPKKSFPVALESSVDSRFRVNNAEGGTILRIGQTLDVERGIVAADLSPYTKVFAEGPAQLRLLDLHGNVEMLEGKAYFEVSPGGSGFQIHCPAGVIRDIGTKFGVDVKANGFVETRVMEGQVRITQPDGTVSTVNAGHSVGWGKAGEKSVEFNPSHFTTELPKPRVILSDNFNEPDGTVLDQKTADVGGKWGQSTTFTDAGRERILISNGKIDTSFGTRTISTTCRQTGTSARRHNYIVRFSTGVPENMADKPTRPSGWEKIIFKDAAGTSMLSLVGRASESHQWFIRDEVTGKESAGSNISALEKHQFTLFYECSTGRVSLHRGISGNTLDSEVASLISSPGLTIGGVAISNDHGGDLALDDLSVNMIDYSEGNGLKD